MSRVVTNVLALFFLMTFLVVGPVAAASNKTLLVIDGAQYTTQDYRDWWRIWQDPGMVFPDTPGTFIDYLLFAEEGRLMEYDLTPEYLRTIEVFLTVRALNALKFEEIDQKINITEKQIREYFVRKYTPVWSLQILSYDEQAKAKAVADELKAFDGQKAGRLVFADLAGVQAEQGGPLNYDETSVDPAILVQTKNEYWLPILANLKQGYVSEPFFLEDRNLYVVIRMDEIKTELGEEALEQKRGSIRNKLWKQASHELTSRLVEKLKKEQHVKIDEDLLQRLNLHDEYPEELLAQPVMQMDGFDFPAGLLIQNMQKEQELRTSLAEDVVKRMVINDIISQMVTTRAALNRHYENRPPLDGVYKFYLNNTLRKFVEAGIRKRISVSDDEIASYYNNNQALYSEPESFSYAIIQGDSDLLNPISAALAQGADFFDQAQIHSLDAQIKTVVGDKIRPEVKIQLALLKKGEVTQPFALDSEAAIGRLLNHTDMKLIPLEQVRSSIKKILTEEKFGVAKTAYLAKLRSVREIAVKESVWNKLKEEYAK